MRVNPETHPAMYAARTAAESLKAPAAVEGDDNEELRKAFGAFVGQTLFGQMLKSMRKTVGKPAYLYGGKAEEIFTQQLDQLLAEKMADASAEKFTGPMFELFMMPRR